jgi:hypothetical protein
MIVKRGPLYRPEPAGKPGPEAYKTYQLLTPRDTHFRAGTCAEVDCPRMRNGWRSVFDLTTTDGVKQANWVRMKSGRAYTYTQAGPVVTFTFPAGQRCFGRHTVALEREPFLRIAGGDYRGNPRRVETVALRPRSWVDNFGEHLLTLSDASKRG